jgi:hypothetical protein
LVVTEPRAASPTSWEREPFTSGVSIPYKAVFSEKQFARLKIGLVPKRMEDKWFIYYEEPHLFLHRSWTGQPVYRLALRKTPDGAEIDEALWSKVLAEAPDPDPGYQVQLIDFLLSNLLLGESKPFPLPQAILEPAPGVIQHHIAGTGFPQVMAPPKKSD